MGHVTLPRPFHGWFVIRWLGLATINLYTKYEVSMFTHYEGDEKCKNWGGLGVMGKTKSSETSPFYRTHMTSYSTLIETMRLSCTVFECFPSKVANFNPPHLHLILFEFRHNLVHQKTRVPGLSCSVICVILHLAILIQYRSVTDTHTDEQTDGQTHDDSI